MKQKIHVYGAASCDNCKEVMQRLVALDKEIVYHIAEYHTKPENIMDDRIEVMAMLSFYDYQLPIILCEGKWYGQDEIEWFLTVQEARDD